MHYFSAHSSLSQSFSPIFLHCAPGSGNKVYTQFPDARKPGKHQLTVYETYQLEQMLAGEHPWAPFASGDEWEFVEFLATSRLSEVKIEKLLHTHGKKLC